MDYCVLYDHGFRFVCLLLGTPCIGLLRPELEEAQTHTKVGGENIGLLIKTSVPKPLDIVLKYSCFGNLGHSCVTGSSKSCCRTKPG